VVSKYKIDSILRNYFLGKGFAKPRLIFSAGILDFARAKEGSGEESTRALAFCFGEIGRAISKILNFFLVIFQNLFYEFQNLL